MEIEFTGEKDFEAYTKAEQWCKDNDYSYGPMCYPEPTALMEGSWDISKWRNLSPLEKLNVTGSIKPLGRRGSFRHGPVIITIK